MQAHIANRFGVAAITIAIIVVVTSVLTVMLPYRLSPSQKAFLDTALWVELAGPLLAITFGSAALRGDPRSRRFGFIAIAMSVVAFVLAMSTSHVHSISRS
jgi:hypothetical protein